MGSLSSEKPCFAQLAWEKGLHSNLNLSMCVEWGEFSPPWEDRATPNKLVRGQTPPCTDLISETAEVLRTKERWPMHFCYNEFLEESTRLWAESQAFTVGGPRVAEWASMHPLPIGRRALMIRREMNDLSAWSEVLNVLPFEEYEKAMWALRVEEEWAPVGKGVLDIFGLATYPTEVHQRLDTPVAGELAYVVRGQSRSLVDLLDAAERWWAQFRGLTFKGRPKGTGTWKDQEHLLMALRKAAEGLRSEGVDITQDNLGACFKTDAAGLRRWFRQHGLRWGEVKKAL